MSEPKNTKNKQLKVLSLELTQFAVDNAADAIFWLNRAGEFIYANHAAVAHIGYSQSELFEMNVHQIDCDFPFEKWQKHWDKLRIKKSMTFDSRHLTKNGKIIPVEIMVSHLELDDNEFHCAYVRDISKRKKAEEVLLQSEKRFRMTLDATSDGMWDRNLATGEVYYGSNWASALGYLEEDLITGKIVWEKLLHPEDKEKTLQSVRDHLAGKTRNYEAEFRLRNCAGEWQWIQARGKIIEHDATGQPLRFVGTHTDITNRKEAEDSLMKSTEETKLFAYSVAHDLKNPAVAIQCLAKRFRDKVLELSDKKKQIYCDQLLKSSEQIVTLVDKINSYISSKETPLVLEEIPLKEVVRICCDEFSAQLQIRSITWSEFNEQPIIRADRISMIRVLRNLVENALKYGGAQLSKITVEYQNTASFHVISVRDDGVGMKVEDSEKIFKPFERRESSIGQGGSGLGLAIVKEIAGHHKGEVWVEQNRKKGLRFCFAISKNL